MVERDSIEIATLHLDGEANDWWFHVMKTLGHDQVTTYEEFTRRLAERFERKDPEITFREHAHVKQTETLEAYISEFLKFAVMVTNISKARLILLFVEGLVEPLKGLVKSYRPSTLQDAQNRTSDMQDAIPRTMFPPTWCQ